MSIQSADINFKRIAEAIAFLQENFQKQPTLEETAAHVHLSPHHFQRMFTEWAGVSPKKYLQFLNVEFAKTLLNNPQATLFDTAEKTGLSGTGRLYDLFVKIEGMTPGEYKNGGENLKIYYRWIESPFGPVLIGNTDKGICYLQFDQQTSGDPDAIKQLFPRAQFVAQDHPLQVMVQRIFSGDWSQPDQVKVHLKGTPFQLKVWQALINIPSGQITSYGRMANDLGKPTASRAVGNAIGKNPIAYLIPCHRVIQSGGMLGGYRWGVQRKSAMIAWEAAQLEKFWSERLNTLEKVINNQ